MYNKITSFYIEGKGKKYLMDQEPWISRMKWLTQALIVSGTLNIGLVATFVYMQMQEQKVTVNFKPDVVRQKNPLLTNEILLQTYAMRSYQELLSSLTDREPVEEGYAKRDLALASLVAFHHFNLERAVGGMLLQRRAVRFSLKSGEAPVDLMLFPGLTDFQFEAVIQYAKKEKWPLTSQGLFFEIKGSQANVDATLLEAFYLTEEFQSVFTLFSRLGMRLEKEEVVKLLVDGDFATVRDFTQQQKAAQDLSVNRARGLLIDYLNQRSQRAASILLKHDLPFSLKRLSDSQIIFILDSLLEKAPHHEKFCQEILLSPRSDLIWKKAAARLYLFAGEPLPDTFDRIAVLRKFVADMPIPPKQHKDPELPRPSPNLIRPTQRRSHLIQDGDNLWKIAKKYHVSVEALRKQNQLESDLLRPGRKLEIPESR